MDNGNGGLKSTQDNAYIDHALRELESMLEESEKALESHRSKIDPILTPEEPTKEPDGRTNEAPNPPRSNVAYRIEQCARRLRWQVRRLNTVTARAEV